MPVAQFELAQNQLDIPVEVTLDGSGSSDCDGEIAVWRWSIDGTLAAEGATVAVVFDTAGEYEIGLEVEDDQGNLASQSAPLVVLEDFCPILPITIDQNVFASANDGDIFEQIPAATGSGNYSQLTWDGSNSATVFASSLALPGDSYNYLAPNDSVNDANRDHILNIGDWVQGNPGKNNGSQVRAALDLLIGQEIIVPTWSEYSETGSKLDYLVADFATVELIAYELSGDSPWFSLVYKGQARCYNTPPVAIDQSLETLEDTALEISLDVTDPEGDLLAVEFVQVPEHGVLSIVEGTRVRYVPDPDFFGADGFIYRVSDGELDSEDALVTIAVLPVNDAPTASGQSVIVDEDQNLTITLSGQDVDGDALSFSVISGPANGALSGSGANLNFTPYPDFNGVDSLQFVVSDGVETSQPAMISISVTPVNDAPTANGQTVSVDEDQNLTITLTGQDVDGDALDFIILTGPANGVLSGSGANLSYAPGSNYNGADNFQFVVSDGVAQSATASVSITIQAVNDAPVGQDFDLVGDEDSVIALSLEGSDVDGDVLSFQLVDQPANGSISGTGSDLTYTPIADFNGQDQFSYQLSDGQIGAGPYAVTITVNAVNDLPVVVGESVATDEDVSLAVTLSASDVDGDILTFAITSGPGNGTLSGLAPDLLYTPNPDYFGDDSFTVVANDGTANSDPANVTISIVAVNDAPIGEQMSVVGNEDQTLAINLTGLDVDGDPLSFAVLSAPTNGALSGTPPNLTYTPTQDFNGSDTFAFLANDGSVDSSAANVEITILPVNDAPQANADSVSVDQGSSVAITLAGFDVDGDALTFITTKQPSQGALSGSGGNLVYAPSPTYSGIDSFDFVANDGTASSSPATISITVNATNRAPMISSTPVTQVDEDQIYVYAVQVDDLDAGDTASFNLLAGPDGMAIDPASGQIRWVPDAALTSSLEGLNSLCRVHNDVGDFIAVTQWRTNLRNVNHAPLVAPLFDNNDDGQIDTRDMPSIIVMDGPTLTVLDNATGAKVWSLGNGLFDYTATTPAVADIDLDGIPEIVLKGPGEVVAITNTGDLKWRSDPLAFRQNSGGSVSFANVTGDDHPEILLRGFVLDYQGKLLLALPGTTFADFSPLALDLIWMAGLKSLL